MHPAPDDPQNADLSPNTGNTGAQRQARYAEQQKALGRRQRSFWATDDEYHYLTQALAQKRAKNVSTDVLGPTTSQPHPPFGRPWFWLGLLVALLALWVFWLRG